MARGPGQKNVEWQLLKDLKTLVKVAMRTEPEQQFELTLRQIETLLRENRAMLKLYREERAAHTTSPSPRPHPYP